MLLPYNVQEIKEGKCENCYHIEGMMALFLCDNQESKWYCRECFHKIVVGDYANQLCDCGVGWV